MKVDDSEICAGDLDKGGIDACQTDSGGPLVWKDEESKEWKQIGVVSWGLGCGAPGNPGVYGKVTHVLPWMKMMRMMKIKMIKMMMMIMMMMIKIMMMIKMMK